MRSIQIPIWECGVCGNSWQGRSPNTPKQCPRCKSPNWNKPREGTGVSGKPEANPA